MKRITPYIAALSVLLLGSGTEEYQTRLTNYTLKERYVSLVIGIAAIHLDPPKIEDNKPVLDENYRKKLQAEIIKILKKSDRDPQDGKITLDELTEEAIGTFRSKFDE